MCIKILKAIQTIHSCSLNEGISFVHLDIKPQNIVFTDETETSIKLIDFGFTVNILKNTVNIIGEGLQHFTTSEHHFTITTITTLSPNDEITINTTKTTGIVALYGTNISCVRVLNNNE